MIELAVSNVRACLKGLPCAYIVNPEALARSGHR